MPSSLSVMAAIGKAFSVEHRHCKPSERGAMRFRYSDALGWAHSWDTGASSMFLYRFMMGLAELAGRRVLENDGWHGDIPIPHDPSDFGRCYRLLKVAPEWRARMSEMTRVPAWRPFVERWDELEALYEEESPSGRCPKLYEALQACRR